MKSLTCDTVTDLLPDRVRNGLSQIDGLRVDRHLERCASCRAQRDLLGLIHRTRPEVPAGLPARVSGAVAARRPPRRRARAGIAAAASIVLALVSGGLLVTRIQQFEREPTPAPAPAPAGEDITVMAAVQVVRPNDPLLAGGPQLAQLSVEELATLLAELDR